MDYEWDKNKRLSNIEKHGTDFVAVVGILKDKERIETEDTRQNYGEKRMQVIGTAKPGVLFVVYTDVRHSGKSGRPE